MFFFRLCNHSALITSTEAQAGHMTQMKKNEIIFVFVSPALLKGENSLIQGRSSSSLLLFQGPGHWVSLQLLETILTVTDTL